MTVINASEALTLLEQIPEKNFFRVSIATNGQN